VAIDKIELTANNGRLFFCALEIYLQLYWSFAHIFC